MFEKSLSSFFISASEKGANHRKLQNKYDSEFQYLHYVFKVEDTSVNLYL